MRISWCSCSFGAPSATEARGAEERHEAINPDMWRRLDDETASRQNEAQQQPNPWCLPRGLGLAQTGSRGCRAAGGRWQEPARQAGALGLPKPPPPPVCLAARVSPPAALPRGLPPRRLGSCTAARSRPDATATHSLPVSQPAESPAKCLDTRPRPMHSAASRHGTRNVVGSVPSAPPPSTDLPTCQPASAHPGHDATREARLVLAHTMAARARRRCNGEVPLQPPQTQAPKCSCTQDGRPWGLDGGGGGGGGAMARWALGKPWTRRGDPDAAATTGPTYTYALLRVPYRVGACGALVRKPSTVCSIACEGRGIRGPRRRARTSACARPPSECAHLLVSGLHVYQLPQRQAADARP